MTLGIPTSLTVIWTIENATGVDIYLRLPGGGESYLKTGDAQGQVTVTIPCDTNNKLFLVRPNRGNSVPKSFTIFGADFLVLVTVSDPLPIPLLS